MENILRLETDVAVLKEQNGEKMRRISDIQDQTLSNSREIGVLTVGISNLHQTVDILSKFVFGFAGIILTAFVVAVAKGIIRPP